MKERPIIMQAESVRAILAGTKIQTRRVIKPQPIYPITSRQWTVPVYPPNVRYLWVREAWCELSFEGPVNVHTTDGCIRRQSLGTERHHSNRMQVCYRATDGDKWALQGATWRPSIFMPRWASRITLELTAVRVERVQDISEIDCEAELGVAPHSTGNDAYPLFHALWDSINATRGYSWESNPWVWCLSFKRVEP